MRQHGSRAEASISIQSSSGPPASAFTTPRHDLERVHSDAENVFAHLQEYIAGFDPAVREIFDAFDFEATLGRLQKAGLLYRVLGRVLDPDLDLHPDRVPNAAMGDLFEELIRRFSEISNETAGEHFTRREVVRKPIAIRSRGPA